MKCIYVILTMCVFLSGLMAQAPYGASPVAKTGGKAEGIDQLSTILSAYPKQYDFQSTRLIDRSLGFLYLELEDSKISKKSLNKRIPLIKKAVEAAFLNTYVPGLDFEQLIRKGYYNDITATALYALVFEHLNIPYAIRLEKHQVYPVVDPDGAWIAISIPGIMLPKDGRQEAFAQKYVELLEEMQMLKNGESKMNSLESLFQRYYFSQDQLINLNQLPGLVYWRSALGHYQQQEYHLALAKLDLAQQIMPMPRHQPFRIACLFQLAAQFKPENPQTFTDLFKLYDSHPVPLVEDEILALFIGISDNQLFNHRQMDQFEKSYQFFLEKAKDNSQLEKKLQTVYLLQKAKYHAKSANYDKVFLLADSIFRQQPQNEAVQEVLAGLFKGEFKHGRNFQEGLEQIYDYRVKYPYLRYHKGMQDLELFYSAERIRYYFDQDNEGAGIQYLTLFENLISQYGKTERIDQWIKTAYIAASNYYYRMNEFQKARQMTQNAAQLLPNDAYFQHRIELLNFYP